MNPLTPIIFCIMMVIMIGSVEAQPYQETHLSVNGVEIPIGTGQVQVLKVPSGQVYATIHIEEPEMISCNLNNCVSAVVVDNIYGGEVAKISGTETNETSQIQLVNSHGQVTFTIIMMPQEITPKQTTTQDPSLFGIQIPEIQNEAIWIVGGLLGVGMIALAVVIYVRGNQIGTITTI